jgi:hypothetical protein
LPPHALCWTLIYVSLWGIHCSAARTCLGTEVSFNVGQTNIVHWN